MQQISDCTSFQIILKSNDEEDLSDYWQDQCRYLYDEISIALPEGSIKPLTLESSVGEKNVIFDAFSIVIISHITAEIFITVVSDAIKRWQKYRPGAKVEIFGKRPDGEMTEITKQLLPE